MIPCNQSTLSPEDVAIYISSDYIVRQTIIHFITRAYRQQNVRLRVESSTEPDLSHDPLSGSSHVVSIALHRNSSFFCYATLSPIGPDDEGILLCSKYLHPRQNNLGNKMCDMRLLEV